MCNAPSIAAQNAQRPTSEVKATSLGINDGQESGAAVGAITPDVSASRPVWGKSYSHPRDFYGGGHFAREPGEGIEPRPPTGYRGGLARPAGQLGRRTTGGLGKRGGQARAGAGVGRRGSIRVSCECADWRCASTSVRGPPRQSSAVTINVSEHLRLPHLARLPAKVTLDRAAAEHRMDRIGRGDRG